MPCHTTDLGWPMELQAGEGSGLNRWLVLSGSTQHPLPTFMKAIRRQKPPPQPAGIPRCEPEALARWCSDHFKVPPYQYRRLYLMTNDDRDLRYASIHERERLLGFGRDQPCSLCLPTKPRTIQIVLKRSDYHFLETPSPCFQLAGSFLNSAGYGYVLFHLKDVWTGWGWPLGPV